VGAEERYVTTLKNQPFIPTLREQEPFPGFEELINAAEESGKALIDIANTAVPWADPAREAEERRQL
jgi:hypothetical protein